MPTPVIQLERVGKFFEDEGVTAIKDVSFVVYEGEFVSLVGPSGCGKTTVLHMIGDIADPGQEEGRILVKGMTPRQARSQRVYGIVMQDPALFDHLTVFRNVALPLVVMGEKRKARQQASYFLEIVGIDRKFWNYYPYKLSGGMKQRVAIARALTISPDILLMDEPFGALDAMTREDLNFELLRIWKESGKMSILFVTHSIEEAVILSDRVIVMSSHPGTIIGNVEVGLSRPRTRQTRKTADFLQLVDKVRSFLGQNNNNQG